jgi:hypothetical protein
MSTERRNNRHQIEYEDYDNEEEDAHSDSGDKRQVNKKKKKQFNKSKVFNRVIKGNIQNRELVDESEEDNNPNINDNSSSGGGAHAADVMSVSEHNTTP